MKNPNRLLKKIRVAVNKNIRNVLYNYPESIVQPVPKKFIKSESPLRRLYNEAYYNHYAGLSYSALSVCNVIMERLTRLLYNHFKPEGKSKEWKNIITELKAYFKKSNIQDKDILISLMDDFDYYRDRIRNLILHGKVEEYLKDTRLKVNAVKVSSLKKEEIEIGYNESIHGDKKSKILDDRMTIDTHYMLVLFSIVVQKFNKYIFDEL